MTLHHLIITADNQPTAMEQLLRVVRYRGFKVNSLVMDVSADEIINIQLGVLATRPITLLTKQLLKLVDVNEGTLQE